MDHVKLILSGIAYDSLITEEACEKYRITPAQVKFILCLHSLLEENNTVSTPQLIERLNLSEVSFYTNLKPLEQGNFVSVQKFNYRNYFHLREKGKAVIAYYKLLLKRTLKTVISL